MSLFYTPKQLADMLGKTTREIRRLLITGGIRGGHKVNGVWVIDLAYEIVNVHPTPGRPKGSPNKRPYPKRVKRKPKKPRELDKRTREYKLMNAKGM